MPAELPHSQHPATAALLALIDPHRGHDSDDVHGFPHPRVCLTCSDEDAQVEVEYFLVDRDEAAPDAAQYAATVLRTVAAAWAPDGQYTADDLLGEADLIEGTVR